MFCIIRYNTLQHSIALSWDIYFLAIKSILKVINVQLRQLEMGF